MDTACSDVFQGELASVTLCLTCEAKSSRKEKFFDLGIDLEKNTSLSYNMQNFSKQELMKKDDKFFCDTCNCKQVASRFMQIKGRPKVLIV